LSAVKLLELTGAEFEGLVVYGGFVMSGSQDYGMNIKFLRYAALA
jgi:hypothetical protein